MNVGLLFFWAFALGPTIVSIAFFVWALRQPNRWMLVGGAVGLVAGFLSSFYQMDMHELAHLELLLGGALPIVLEKLKVIGDSSGISVALLTAIIGSINVAVVVGLVARGKFVLFLIATLVIGGFNYVSQVTGYAFYG